jgi:hypothetical protein
LDKSDFSTLQKSPKLFARRFDYPASRDLVSLIKKELLHKEHSNSYLS